MRKRMIAALMLIFALMMLAPVGGSRSAVQAETVQAASGSWQAKGGKWYKIRVKVAYKFHRLYGRKGPILNVISMEPTEAPEQEVATFY